MKKLLLFLIFIVISIIGYSQITFEKTYGSSGMDEGYSLAQTSDGGFIITGIFGRFSVSDYGIIYLLKTDPNGDTLWTNTFGSYSGSEGISVAQTYDGGYIIAGTTLSFGASYLIKTNANGDSL
jgi:outer membrane protein assembly factor BamB